jgi:hypothetical protein
MVGISFGMMVGFPRGNFAAVFDRQAPNARQQNGWSVRDRKRGRAHARYGNRLSRLAK